MNRFQQDDIIIYGGVSPNLTVGRRYTVVSCRGGYVDIIDDRGNRITKTCRVFQLDNNQNHHSATSTNSTTVIIDDPAPQKPDCDCHKNTYKDPATPHFSWCKNDSSKKTTARDIAYRG